MFFAGEREPGRKAQHWHEKVHWTSDLWAWRQLQISPSIKPNYNQVLSPKEAQLVLGPFSNRHSLDSQQNYLINHHSYFRWQIPVQTGHAGSVLLPQTSTTSKYSYRFVHSTISLWWPMSEFPVVSFGCIKFLPQMEGKNQNEIVNEWIKVRGPTGFTRSSFAEKILFPGCMLPVRRALRTDFTGSV